MIDVDAVNLMCVFDDFSEHKSPSDKIIGYHFLCQRKDLVEINLDISLWEMTATLLVKSLGITVNEIQFPYCRSISINLEQKIIKMLGGNSKDQAPFFLCTIYLDEAVASKYSPGLAVEVKLDTRDEK